jgi:hypothetical protein
VNSNQAKHALLLCRSRSEGQADPEIARAAELAHSDPVVGDWFHQHLRFQHDLQRSFREMPVPPGLAAGILARARIVRLPWWRKPTLLAAAAAIVLLLAFSAHWWQASHRGAPDNFSVFRSRMVGNVLRTYTMDITTNDTTAVRRFLDSQQAPADYELPAGLANVPLLGAGVQAWAGEKVSMICLQPQGESTLFLFVVNQAAVHPSVGTKPEFVQVNTLMTASWTQGGKSYMLATSSSRESLQRHF